MLVNDAGLVLVHVFLPQLFARGGLLGADGRFRSREAAGRATHLLRYLVDERLDTPPPLLVLEKLLCGLGPDDPVPPAIQADAEERTICHALLTTLLAQWPEMRGSSVAALRHGFFLREGRLERIDGGWRLVVARKTLDLFVDRLPWSLAKIHHPWMPEPLSVSW